MTTWTMLSFPECWPPETFFLVRKNMTSGQSMKTPNTSKNKLLNLTEQTIRCINLPMVVEFSKEIPTAVICPGQGLNPNTVCEYAGKLKSIDSHRFRDELTITQEAIADS